MGLINYKILLKITIRQILMSSKLSIATNYHLNIRMTYDAFIKQLNAIIGNPIIAVKKKQPFSSRFFNSNITSNTQTFILFMYHANAVIMFRIFITHCWARIWRSVVNENNLKVRICLIEYALNTFIQILLNLEYWNYY